MGVRPGMDFVLSVGNPLYDNQCLAPFRAGVQRRPSNAAQMRTTPTYKEVVTDGPALPPKNSTYAAVPARDGIANSAYVAEPAIGRGGVDNPTYDAGADIVLATQSGGDLYGYSNL